MTDCVHKHNNQINPHDHDTHHHHEHEGHDHHHSHGHVHVAQNKLKIAIILGTLILIAEVVGGIISNSLALLSDAGHMLTDVISLIVAFLAVKISTNQPTKKMTYGYYRITILAALLNALTLIGIAIYIGFEAYKRLLHPEPVQGVVLFVTATIGLVLNLYIGLGMREQADNVNIKSAMLHVLGDAAASAGVIIAGIIMYFTEWYIIDPILSVLIALVVAGGAWRILKETYNVLMEGTPDEIVMEDVLKEIQTISGIVGVHDLHIWSLTSNRNALSCHIVVDGELKMKEAQGIVKNVAAILERKFDIDHSTIQLEDENHNHDINRVCCVH